MIHEPMTLATDLLLAFLTLYLGLRLMRRGWREKSRATRLWARGFFASGLAALAGGLYHGFGPLLGGVPRVFLWKGSVFAIGLAGFFFFAGALWAWVAPRPRRWLLAAALLQLVCYLAWMVFHDAFRYVLYDYAPLLAAILLLALWNLVRRRSAAAAWVAAGVVVSFLAAGVQASGLALHRHFNHNDLYHVVQAGAFLLLYRGGTLLRDRLES